MQVCRKDTDIPGAGPARQSMLALATEDLAGVVPGRVGLEHLHLAQEPGRPPASDGIGRAPEDRVGVAAGQVDEAFHPGFR